ncbi:MAG: aminomethyltransferase family protein [Betaproteobacteria bacterium]|nr:aminomethyltransferase family protein [Betaproteobacteria bacterium]
MIKHTPYYHKLAAAGAKFQDRGGFATINFITSIEDEHRAVRERVGMFDVYYQVGVEIKGRDAERLLMLSLVNDVRRVRDGGVLYSSICTDQGGIIDDLTCFRFAGDRFWVSPTPSRVQAVVAALEEQAAGLNVSITNLGYSNAYLSIQGPRSRDLLSVLTDADLSTSALPYFRCTTATVADVPGTVISRTGYSGELGYELFYPVEYAEHVWDAVSRVGAKDEIRICGMKTMRSLRIEKMYLLYGLDIHTETDPLSAGLGWTVRFDDRAFVGRSALERIAQHGPKTRLCLLECDGFHSIVHGEDVRFNGESVGKVTSGDPGFSLGRTFAFSYLPAELAKEGISVEIVPGGATSPVQATVCMRAPWDPDRRRATV